LTINRVALFVLFLCPFLDTGTSFEHNIPTLLVQETYTVLRKICQQIPYLPWKSI